VTHCYSAGRGRLSLRLLLAVFWVLVRFLAHRASAADLANSERCSGVNFSIRIFVPIFPPRAPALLKNSSAAAGIFFLAIFPRPIVDRIRHKINA
jgi:hypothetical protein